MDTLILKSLNYGASKIPMLPVANKKSSESSVPLAVSPKVLFFRFIGM